MPPGVVVESLRPDSAAAKAGLRPGDVLLSWRREARPPATPEPAAGEIRSPIDLSALSFQQAARGELSLLGRREGEPFAAVVPAGNWKLFARPRFSGEELARYEVGLRLLEEHKPVEALIHWFELAEAYRRARQPLVSSWLYYKVVRVGNFHQAVAGVSDVVERAHARALEEVRATGDLPRIVAAMHLLGYWQHQRNQLQGATETYLEAIRLADTSEATRLNKAATLGNLSIVAAERGDPAAAKLYVRQALDLREELAPESFGVALCLLYLGSLATDGNQLEEAEAYYRRALALFEQLTPGSLFVADTLGHLGQVAMTRNDFTAAEALGRRALELAERLDPEGYRVASYLGFMGTIAEQRGDWARAEDLLLRSTELMRRHRPGSARLASLVTELAVVSSHQGDMDAAQSYLAEAMTMYEQLGVSTVAAGESLHLAAYLSRARGETSDAERYERRALKIYLELVPEGPWVASSLKHLALLASERGETEQASILLSRALDRSEHTPGTFTSAAILLELGRLAVEQGRLDEAEGHYRQALEICRKLAPGTIGEAEALSLLAAVYQRQNRFEAARDHYGRSLEALESHRQRLGGSDLVRARFAGEWASIYTRYLALLVEHGRNAEAFHVLERSRARRFLELLVERDVALSDPAAQELEDERRRADSAYDRLVAELAAFPTADDGARRAELEHELGRLRQQRREVRARMRTASPRSAALRYPEPMDLAAARRVLDSGTVLLAYAIGEAESHVFVLGPDDGELRVATLEADATALREQVERFRAFLLPSRSAKSILDQGSRLSQWLLAPAAEPIARARRILVLPDGPLHYLPFAALPALGHGAEPRHLVEDKPITVAASITVFAELRKRRTSREIRVSAFGDPQYPAAPPAGGGASPHLRAALDRGLRLDPLPGSRDEVEALGDLFPDDARLYLGPQATEERVLALGGESSIIHFACHGLVNERFPLESALALSVPETWQEGQANGLLQAWEVYEKLRIDAELVTLSACDTALGEEITGEGIVGLTRAFQYAGARSVLASLWGVGDRSTAELMRRFYGYLKDGRPKDEALRAAQLDLLHGETSLEQASHPFHWAAFALFGDWR